MSIVVQTDDGLAPGANSYLSVAEFKAYHDARGNSYVGKTDPQIEQALVKATDYLDNRFTFTGRRRNDSDTQTTQWPRSNVWDIDGRLVITVPAAVKNAAAEYALRALAADLNPDPGVGQVVVKESSELGPLKESKEYANQGQQLAPRYPKADAFLTRAGLVVTGRTLVRA